MENHAVVVFDFETTGLSPQHGDRPIEIGAVLIDNNMIIDRFQGLMNPGFRISSFIESLTGIGNDMVEAAPPCEAVMEKFAAFIGDYPLVAHNASFDRKFLDTEFEYIGKYRGNEMACSMLTARRIFPKSPDHKLGTLVDYCGICTDGTFHRALDDAEMTGHLWIAMLDWMYDTYGLERISFALMQKVSTMARAKVPDFLRRHRVEQETCKSSVL